MHLSILLKISSVILTCLLLVGCLPQANSDETVLLDQQYKTMTNVELVAYEQALSDALVGTNRSKNNAVSVGIGVGSWGRNLGYGISADRRLEGAGPDELEPSLRVRRDEVRAEMRQRGLLPPE